MIAFRTAAAAGAAASAALAGGGPATAETLRADPEIVRADQRIDYPDWSSDTLAAPRLVASAVGDVNGDGLDDVAASTDTTYVTFSRPVASAGAVDAFEGFEIRIAADLGLSSAGDVNGDGLGDVAIRREDSVYVVFGKRTSEPVLPEELHASGGFVIAGVPLPSSLGRAHANSRGKRVVALGDLNADGLTDLAMRTEHGAAIVYPPWDAAGMTIDAGVPGPFVSHIGGSGERALDNTFVDRLGDQDGDGRSEILVGGEERARAAQAAYGIVAPAPGTTTEPSQEVAAGRGFELRSFEGQIGAPVHLNQLLSLGDQNGDGRRDVGLASAGPAKLRVAYSPRFGTVRDIHDLTGSDSRGYTWRTVGQLVDVGDQDGDGRDDLGTRWYVYFPGRRVEPGSRHARYNGFHFDPGTGDRWIVDAVGDLNGDERPELLLLAEQIERTDPTGGRGERGSYSVEVFDSATAPEVPAPEPPNRVDADTLEFPIEVGTGAGTRGGSGLWIRPTLEVSRPGWVEGAFEDGGIVHSGGRRTRLGLRLSLSSAAARERPLVPGKTYWVRYSVSNGRVLTTVGPWSTFVFGGGSLAEMWSPPTPPKADRAAAPGVKRWGTPGADKLRGTRSADQLAGLAGRDDIDGKAGNDVIAGGPGRDRLRGSPGHDIVVGEKGRDRIYAGRGRDFVDSRDGVRDLVRCGKGRDEVRADRRDRVVDCERRTKRRPRSLAAPARRHAD